MFPRVLSLKPFQASRVVVKNLAVEGRGREGQTSTECFCDNHLMLLLCFHNNLPLLLTVNDNILTSCYQNPTTTITNNNKSFSPITTC
eukprot:m.200529 g.200529  ORF g.200529 m.200529 type:complete len:88 (-) comp13711_c0_seq1:63-326(-)